MGSEIQFKLAAHGRAQTVEELAEVRAAGIVLHVARIEMVGDVENDDAGARLFIQERNLETFQDGRVQRQKSREAGVVASPHKVQPIIDDREWKTRADFQRRHDCYLGWRLQFSVCKETMWDVERQRAVLI